MGWRIGAAIGITATVLCTVGSGHVGATTPPGGDNAQLEAARASFVEEVGAIESEEASAIACTIEGSIAICFAHFKGQVVVGSTRWDGGADRPWSINVYGPRTADPETTPSSPTTSPTGTVASPDSGLPSFGDGTHTVGEDIDAGVYTAPGGESCYWERLAGFSGEFDDTIANDFGHSNVILEIQATDLAFSTRRCGEWTPYLGAGDPVDTFGDGDWVVGDVIQPGTWEAPGPEGDVGCYWERASGFTHSFDEIITNEFIEAGRTVVEIAPSDTRFTTRDCGTWTRLD